MNTKETFDTAAKEIANLVISNKLPPNGVIGDMEAVADWLSQNTSLSVSKASCRDAVVKLNARGNRTYEGRKARLNIDPDGHFEFVDINGVQRVNDEQTEFGVTYALLHITEAKKRRLAELREDVLRLSRRIADEAGDILDGGVHPENVDVTLMTMATELRGLAVQEIQVADRLSKMALPGYRENDASKLIGIKSTPTTRLRGMASALDKLIEQQR